MGRETQLLSQSIGDSFDKARVAEHKLSHVLEGQTSESIDDPENHELQEADETLAYWINKIYRDLAILAELLGLPLLAGRIVGETPPKNNVTAMEAIPWDVALHSATLSKAHGLYEPLSTIAEGGAVTGLSVFETILKNTPAVIRAKRFPNVRRVDTGAASSELSMRGSVTPIAQPVLMSPAAPWSSASRFGDLASPLGLGSGLCYRLSNGFRLTRGAPRRGRLGRYRNGGRRACLSARGALRLLHSRR